MKKRFFIYAITVLMLMINLSAASEYIPGVIVMKLKTGITPVDVMTRGENFNYQKIITQTDKHRLKNIYKLNFDVNSDINSIINHYKNDPNVEYVEPLYKHYVSLDSDPRGTLLVPNDPEFQNQWALNKVQAPDAWNVSQGDEAVIISIIDTGIDLNHEDLRDDLWENPGEIDNPNDGVDNDGNGYADDLNGWDFYTNDDYPDDQTGHGTHCAGIASASTNNGIGIAGLGWNCKLMAVRAGSGSEIGYGYEGIIYAAENGADVISCSWGRVGVASNFEKDVMEYASELGAVVVAAAGNDNFEPVQYPAAYPTVLGVISTNEYDIKASNSSYGELANICAPGVGIYSTYKDNSYKMLSGTSMACPHVAGLAGLVASVHPDWDAQQVFEQILVTADDISGQNSGIPPEELGAGRINAYRALTETHPSIRIVEVTPVDDNHNGFLEPDEFVEVQIKLRSVLTDVFDVSAVLTSQDENVEITQNYGSFGDIGFSEYSQIVSFEFQVDSDPPHNQDVQFDLTINSQTYEGTDRFYLTLLSSWGQHDVGNINCAVSDLGVSGNNRGGNPGFLYPNNEDGKDCGFSGTFAVGSSVDWVADGYGNSDDMDPHAWETEPDGYLTITEPGEYADSEGKAVYKASRLWEEGGEYFNEKYLVRQESFAWDNPEYEDFIIFRFWVTNMGSRKMEDVFLAYYWDYDIDGTSYQRNMADYDPVHNLGYMWDAFDDQNPYCGLQMLKPSQPFSFHYVDQEQLVYEPGDLPDRKFYEFMSKNEFTSTSTPMDCGIILSAGPYSLSPGDTVSVAFAFLAGDDLSDLEANALAALEVIAELPESPGDDPIVRPKQYLLRPNFPNPFNQGTTIEFDLPSPSEVTVKIYDIQGRLVRILAENESYTFTSQDSPEYLEWNGKDEHGKKVTSGVYLCHFSVINKMTGETFSDTQKIVLIK